MYIIDVIRVHQNYVCMLKIVIYKTFFCHLHLLHMLLQRYKVISKCRCGSSLKRPNAYLCNET